MWYYWAVLGDKGSRSLPLSVFMATGRGCPVGSIDVNTPAYTRPKLPATKASPRKSLQWRHNECDGVSNYQPHDCLLILLFRRRSKKTLKLRVTGHCEGNSPVTGEFPAQKTSNAENVSIWWRHHDENGSEVEQGETGMDRGHINLHIAVVMNYTNNESRYKSNTDRLVQEKPLC